MGAGEVSAGLWAVRGAGSSCSPLGSLASSHRGSSPVSEPSSQPPGDHQRAGPRTDRRHHSCLAQCASLVCIDPWWCRESQRVAEFGCSCLANSHRDAQHKQEAGFSQLWVCVVPIVVGGCNPHTQRGGYTTEQTLSRHARTHTADTKWRQTNAFMCLSPCGHSHSCWHCNAVTRPQQQQQTTQTDEYRRVLGCCNRHTRTTRSGEGGRPMSHQCLCAVEEKTQPKKSGKCTGFG